MHFFSVQVTTDKGTSGGFAETTSGDKATQIDVTKAFFEELKSVIMLDKCGVQGAYFELGR